MQRLPRDVIYHLVRNALQFGEKRDRRAIEAEDRLTEETAIGRVATRVCDQLDNAQRAVVQIGPPAGIPFDGLDKWRGPERSREDDEPE